MILEGFEIENWSCIKRIAVDGLPSTGVIVLHGPNRTGKSSIIEALRACLMDAKSTSKALGRGFTKNSSEKPRVSVTFRAAGASWKITKQFNSKNSKLERRTTTGDWKLETDDPSEAHERTRVLTGGSASNLGLHQLLWLTQAEFHLPDPKKFDAGVQAQLRDILGVLQTPLDDRFLARVKETWACWFGVRSKPGEKPKLKKDCALDKALTAHETQRKELDQIEERYRSYEKMIERSSDLEVLSRNLRRQHAASKQVRDGLQEEYERSLTRLNDHQVALEHANGAEKKLEAAQAERQKRVDSEEQFHETERYAEIANRQVEKANGQLRAAQQRLRDLSEAIQGLRNVGRELQDRRNEVTNRLQRLALKERVDTLRENLRRAECANSELEFLKGQAREHPGPDPATLKTLEDNRTEAGRLRANLEAAAIALTLAPESGAAVARLVIDGAAAVEAGTPTSGTPVRCSVRRRAEITIPGWGRAELTRGSDARSLYQIEHDLNELDHAFADGLAPFGIAAGDPAPLDRLRDLAAEKKVRDPEMKSKKDEIGRLAPRGVDRLQEEAGELENRLLATEAGAESAVGDNDLPSATGELERLATQLKETIDANDNKILAAEELVRTLETEIDGTPNSEAAAGKKKPKTDISEKMVLGLRQQEADAKAALSAFNATASVRRSELERMLTAEQIEQEIRDAAEALDRARSELETARLSDSEKTIRDRIAAADEGLHALQERLNEAQRDFHQIEGALQQTEGLHQERTSAAVRFGKLTREAERERLEADAYDRLYALFEECRDKQLGTVMGPIHDRVLHWMRLLRISEYESIRFNDQFLPERLIAGDGAMELTLEEESTGTIEQIALMVRLALGSTLSTPEEPVVAVLDDPLTHSDVIRLDQMRGVLRKASVGDSSSTPPAGPLQIVVFTCHSEWFAMDGAKIIDLSKPDVLRRSW